MIVYKTKWYWGRLLISNRAEILCGPFPTRKIALENSLPFEKYVYGMAVLNGNVILQHATRGIEDKREAQP